MTKHVSCTNGWTDFDEPYLIRREIEGSSERTCIWLRILGAFQEKTTSQCEITVFLRYVQGIVVGIVDCLEYLFSCHIIISS